MTEWVQSKYSKEAEKFEVLNDNGVLRRHSQDDGGVA